MSNNQMISAPKLLAADNDRDMLEYLSEGYESQVHVCEQCGHEEPLETYDLASDLREYLAAYPHAPAGQHQGEPVAIVDEGDDGLFVDLIYGDNGNPLRRGDKLYTHADPAEVERLREQVETLRLMTNDYLFETERLRTQLAERDALLRDSSGKLVLMAAHLIGAPLRGLHDLQDEDKRMTRPRVDSAVDFADARLKDAAYQLRRITDALSASAEPSEPVERDDLTNLATWKRRAIEAESKLRTYDPRIVEMSAQAMDALLAEPKPEVLVLTKCKLCDQLQADLTARDEQLDRLRAQND